MTLIYSYSSPPNRWLVLAASLLSGGAALTMGLLVGFIFGIPRAVQNTTVPATPGLRIRANTNLEQISDWLTKIIVGVSLVQLGSFSAWPIIFRPRLAWRLCRDRLC